MLIQPRLALRIKLLANREDLRIGVSWTRQVPSKDGSSSEGYVHPHHSSQRISLPTWKRRANAGVKGLRKCVHVAEGKSEGGEEGPLNRTAEAAWH